MPIYEYRCESCGTFDVMQKITENPLKKCPTCKKKVTKLMSATSFQLKGSGWYVTDYGGKKGSGEPSSESTGSASTEGKGADAKTGEAKAKSETKSDPKSKAKPKAKSDSGASASAA